MKCPFLIKRIEVFDEKGKKVGEDIAIQECIKSECMVYDGATKFCSLLSSNMKAGALLDDLKKDFQDLKAMIHEHTEAVNRIVAGTVQGAQTVLVDRLDILKKQNEVMVLGFGRLSEVFSNKLEEMRTKLSSFTEHSGDLDTRLENLKEILEKLTTTDQYGLEAITRQIGEATAVHQKTLESIDAKIISEEMVASFQKEIGKNMEAMKIEINNLKNDQFTSMNNIQGVAFKFEDLFRKSTAELATIGDKMSDLNRNYLESLGKIAGLAEGMRKGVENIGEGLHGSVKELTNEMKKEIGALEKQYAKTFDDVAKLAGRFGELNEQIKGMIKEVHGEFKESFERQAKLSDYTKDIVQHIKGYFEKEDARYEAEQLIVKKKEGIDHFDRATLYYYRGNYELALNEITKALEIDTTAEYLNLKGLLLTELGKFSDSQRTYQEALKLEPNLAEIHNNLGLLYLRMKRLDDAMVSFQEAVKKNVNYALAYLNLGKALVDLERFDDALKAYTRALEIDPSNQEAREAIKLYKEGKIA